MLVLLTVIPHNPYNIIGENSIIFRLISGIYSLKSRWTDGSLRLLWFSPDSPHLRCPLAHTTITQQNKDEEEGTVRQKEKAAQYQRDQWKAERGKVPLA